MNSHRRPVAPDPSHTVMAGHPAREEGMTTPAYETASTPGPRTTRRPQGQDWAALDVEHLAEEVDDSRKTERRAVRSQPRVFAQS